MCVRPVGVMTQGRQPGIVVIPGRCLSRRRCRTLLPRLNRAPRSAGRAPVKITKGWEPLLQDGLIDKVPGRLMSGKESDVYVVRCHGEIRCGKGYIDGSASQLPQTDAVHGRAYGAQHQPLPRHGKTLQVRTLGAGHCRRN